MDDLKEARRYWKLKEKAQDRTLWRTQFGRCRLLIEQLERIELLLLLASCKFWSRLLKDMCAKFEAAIELANKIKIAEINASLVILRAL
jgi:hypothetical protein